MHRLVLKALNKFKVLKFVNTTTYITVNNGAVRLPVKNSMGYELLHDAEPWMIPVLQKLKPLFPGSFMDVGVNIGQTLMKVRSVYGQTNYLGFEPNPVCVGYVTEMIRLNGWQQCNIIPTGISNKTEILKLSFFHASATDTTASIIGQFRKNDRVDHYIYIPVVNEQQVQELLPAVKNFFLKIDVEGAELEVVEGLNNWISKYRPVMIMEILPVDSRSGDRTFRLERQEKLEALLKQMDFVISKIDKANTRLHEMETIGIHGDITDCDYVLFPRELKADILRLFN